MSTETKAFIAVGILTVLVTLGIVFKVKESDAFNSKQPKGPALGSVVRLVHRDKTYCSGVVIDKETVLTAGHCILIKTMFGYMLDPEPIEIRSSDNKETGVIGKPKGASIQLDRGIIKGDFSGFQISPYISDVKKSISTRKSGSHWVACGYPMGGALYCGIVTYIHDFGFCLAVHGVLIPGMSGGPTMLADGTVIAINDAVEDEFSIVCPIYNVDNEK